MNIYIAPDLRERMREFQGRISWSKIASAAIEIAIKDYKAMLEMRAERRHSYGAAYKWINDAIHM